MTVQLPAFDTSLIILIDAIDGIFPRFKALKQWVRVQSLNIGAFTFKGFVL